MSKIRLNDEEKPKALAALFNHAKPLGLGILHYKEDHIMDEKEAAKLLAEAQYFDYLEGRIIKVDFARSPLCLELYDRDNGQGSGARAIAQAGISIS